MSAAGRNEIVGLQQVLTRAADAETFDAWLRRAKATGWCRSPVRLVGAVDRINGETGEIVGHFGSAGLPDHALLKACGQRRATRCPTCSATYQADAYQLVAAGLRGGKGIPETVSGHPMVFVTLTAPSFGAVHTRRPVEANPSPCQRADGMCQHDRPRSCVAVHEPDDDAIGQPICPECFQYAAAVLWNAHAGELWRRTTIGIAQPSPTSPASLGANYATRCASASPRSSSTNIEAPCTFTRSSAWTPLATSRLPRRRRSMPTSSPSRSPGPFVRSPCQLRTRLASPAPSGGVHSSTCAPSATTAPFRRRSPAIWRSTRPSPRTRRGSSIVECGPEILDSLDEALSRHLARMVRTAWDLGGRPELEHLRLRNWAHTLGFRGHWLTKSRAWSTTFADLRSTRRDWQRANAGDAVTDEELTIGEWQYAGRGWTTAGDSWLAETAAKRAAETRSIARLERRTSPAGTTGS